MKDILLKNIHIIKCLKCGKSNLLKLDKEVKCQDCGYLYKIIGDKIIAKDEYIEEQKWDDISDDFSLTQGQASKPLFDRLSGPRIKDLPRILDVSGVSLNLGSGQDNYDGYINIDLGNYAPVDIVSSLENIPIDGNTIDLVASNSVLEHIYDYNRVVSEIYRILKKGGYFYLCVPCVCLRHHKYDYHRWTTPGLHKLLGDKYRIIESGTARGPEYVLHNFIDALISQKIKNKTALSVAKYLWSYASYPLGWMRDCESEEYQALSLTIYVLGQKL